MGKIGLTKAVSDSIKSLRSPAIEQSSKEAGFATPGAVQSPCTIAHEVPWGEMDALGHVNNTHYMRWFETARMRYFEWTGVNGYYQENQVGPILASATVCYLAPVVYPDTVLVSTYVKSIGRSSFVMENRAWSTAQDRLVAYGDAAVVMVDYQKEGKAVEIPASLRAAIESLEASHPRHATS